VVRDFWRRTLVEKVPRDQRDSAAGLRRRQYVTVAVVVIGAVVLGLSLRLEPGNPLFYPAALVLALVWTVGSFASGRLHLGRVPAGDRLRRPVAGPVLLGVVLAGVFVLGGLLMTRIPLLDPISDQVRYVLAHANEGPPLLLLAITAVNGVAEELFFRGAAYAAIPRHPVLWTTLAYTVATLATGNVMLGFAAVLLGAVCGLQRRASGGILAPILTHVTWSGIMLFALPAVFG
jgi:membrane protease YdiL (CAAX protease family)